jgi:hypothetical protein
MFVLSIELSPLKPRQEVFSKIIQMVFLFLYSNKICKLQGVQHYVINFFSDLRQDGVFSRGTPVFSINKTDRHHITEILLKVALSTIKQTNILLIH